MALLKPRDERRDERRADFALSIDVFLSVPASVTTLHFGTTLTVRALQCGDAPNGDCTDVDFNIAKGAEYFANTLSAAGDDFLTAIGAYNGEGYISTRPTASSDS